MGLATAAAGWSTCRRESKVIVLMSDGENNRGEIEPLEAGAPRPPRWGSACSPSASAPTRRRRCRCGAAPDGRVMQYAELPVGIDEPLLREIAR
jgi:Ca-activated chloride channel homolog